MKKKIAVYKVSFFIILLVALVTALYLGAYDFNHSVFEIVSTYFKTQTHTADSFVFNRIAYSTYFNGYFNRCSIIDLWYKLARLV